MSSSSVKARPDSSGSPDRQSNSARSSPPRAGKQGEGDSVSDSSSVQSGEAADRRDVDILTQVLSSRSEEYRLLFRLPADEVLIQDFNCALQENILLQGHMYLFVHHICFYSNIFGFETKRIISFHEITCIRKAKTAAIFHNAIEIAAGEKKHFYGSFLSRDEAYRLIVDAWSQHNAEVRAILEERLDSKSEGTGQDWINISDREHDLKQQTNGLISEDSVTTKISEIFENEEADGVRPSSEEVLHWQLHDADAPNVPEYFLMVAEAKFMVGLEDFFNLFFSDDASNFLENFHKACGDKDFQCSRWHRHGEAGRDRDMTFQHPIKIYFGAKFGQCHEIQKLHAYRNGHLVIETSQQVSDVPYGDYFHVQGLWDVEEVNDGNTCILRVHVNVAFSRKTMWKGKIEQSTREEYREVSEIWIKNAHKLLKQKNLIKQDLPGSNGLVTEIAENNLAGLYSIPTLEEFSGNIHIANSHTARIEMPSASHSFLIEGRKFATSMLLSLKELLANIHAYLKSHSNISPMWIVAFLCVVVLVQLCVIALLARKPEVHVISEGSYMNGLAADRLEVIDWFEKRVLLLSEEMLMLDNRLQRMHHEYTLLKEHLHVLQQSRRKS